MEVPSRLGRTNIHPAHLNGTPIYLSTSATPIYSFSTILVLALVLVLVVVCHCVSSYHVDISIIISISSITSSKHRHMRFISIMRRLPDVADAVGHLGVGVPWSREYKSRLTEVPKRYLWHNIFCLVFFVVLF